MVFTQSIWTCMTFKLRQLRHGCSVWIQSGSELLFACKQIPCSHSKTTYRLIQGIELKTICINRIHANSCNAETCGGPTKVTEQRFMYLGKHGDIVTLSSCVGLKAFKAKALYARDSMPQGQRVMRQEI